jgi:multiple sugar transport system permease protein
VSARAFTLTPRRRRKLTSAALTALTYLVLVIMIAPVAWLVIGSLQPGSALSNGTYDLLHPTLHAFSAMWRSVDFGHYLMNSLIVCTVASLLATSFAASAGYALSRYRSKPLSAYSFTVIGTQLIPGAMFLLPVFLGFVWLKKNTPIQLFDTRLGLILVYTAFFTPVSIYFMRSFFLALPRDLEEAALVDGCTRFGAFVRIVIPNAAPGLLATFVYAFLFAWDELLFVSALTQTNAETIPIGIRNFIGNYNSAYDQLMAAGVVSTIPVLIAFFIAQRWLVRGLTAGAVKG